MQSQEKKDQQSTEQTQTTVSEEMLPVIALREGVVFPSTELVLAFGRVKSIASLEEAMKTTKKVIFLAQKKTTLDPVAEDIFQIGTIASIDRTLKSNDDTHALVRGLSRVRVMRLETEGAFLKATYEHLTEIQEDSAEVQALVNHAINRFRHAVNLGKAVEFLNFMKLMSGATAGELADQIASSLDCTTKQKQKMLEIVHVKERLEKVIDLLEKEIKILEIERNIASKTQKKFDEHMKETVLRERMRTIQKELGDVEDEEEKELQDLKKQIKKAGMPKDIEEKAIKELKRLEQLSLNNPETGYIRTWIETMIELPWNKRSKGILSLSKAEKILEEDHYGLKDVKERILEYLAVMKLKMRHVSSSDKKNTVKNRKKAPTILCFVGAPGVGKTSIGKSIARSLGREFVKISLGGVHDEAEIRGHRRTYVGALPGRIIHGLKTAGTKNPVFMLDEVDKLSNDFHGDPSAALLEALDPEQNFEFTDHYLDVPFDLSEVIFITTANVLHTIPHALKDRLETIEFSGYTEDEKFHIAKRHLFSKVVETNGLDEKQMVVPDAILRTIIRLYTREAGVRSLERELGKIARKIARLIADGKKKMVSVTVPLLEDFLGPAKYTHTIAERKDEVGLAAGLAWTPVGGDVLFIETATSEGKGEIILTGHLGKVMQESARAALTYVRSNAKKFGLVAKKLLKKDIHIHVPEGAVPKDGPSAGITITTSILSALTGKKVRHDVAMTGEVTLRGRVLEIGGLKEKVIAAHRAGMKTIIAPKNNQKDLRELPENVQKELQFHFVETMDEVCEIALVGKRKATRKK